MEQVRAFIAVELPGEIKAGLARLQGQLKLGPAFVKWVDPEGIHLTLRFLGNIPLERVPEITKAISDTARTVRPFSLEIGGLGAFPNLSGPRVVWVGVSGDVESIAGFEKGINEALGPLGFPAEAHGFSPHLTLGRVREGTASPERRRLGQLAASLAVEAMPRFRVDKVSLVRSRLTSAGAIYSNLASVKLGRA